LPESPECKPGASTSICEGAYGSAGSVQCQEPVCAQNVLKSGHIAQSSLAARTGVEPTNLANRVVSGPRQHLSRYQVF